MDKILDRVLKFFENKSVHIGWRTSIFVISIFVLTTCDFYFDFTYDYHLNNKIEKLKSINSLKKIYKTDSTKLAELTQIENTIFKRMHYSDRLRNWDLTQLNIFKKSDTTEIKKPDLIKDSAVINKPTRSLFWMILSSNYFFIFLIIVLFILPFTGSVHRELKNVLGVIAGIIIISGIIAIITWIAYQIPLIWNRPYLNYILNFLLHAPFLYLLYLSTKKNKN